MRKSTAILAILLVIVTAVPRAHAQSVTASQAVLDAAVQQHLASTEFQVLEGTRILLRDGPSLSVDEVLARRRAPRPRRQRR